MNMSANMCCSFLSYINIIGQVHEVAFKESDVWSQSPKK